MSGFEMPDNNSPKNYPTGSYIGICLLCASSFMGPKMSRICAECTQQSKGDEDGKGD